MSRYDVKRNEEKWSSNLHEYLRDDIYYQRYLKDKTYVPKACEQYCIDHCLDVVEALKEITKLKTNYSNLKNKKKSEGVIVDGE